MKESKSLGAETSAPPESVSSLSGQIGEVGHTPGPWRVTVDGARIIVDAGRSDGGIKGVAICGSKGDARAEANARLIAAAPELLAALREWAVLDDQGVMVTGLLDRTRAAIAKATGK